MKEHSTTGLVELKSAADDWSRHWMLLVAYALCSVLNTGRFIVCLLMVPLRVLVCVLTWFARMTDKYEKFTREPPVE